MTRKLHITLALALCATAVACDDEPTTETITDESDPAAAEPAAAEPAAAGSAAAEAPTAGSTVQQAPEHATLGQPAPPFTLTDSAGTQHTLSQYRGQVVVLEWISPECPFVQRHYQARTMQRLVEAFPADRVKWLAIDSSHFVTAAETETFRREQSLSYPVLLDANGTVGHAYQARTTPHMYVIDQAGVLRYSGAIDDDPRNRNDQDVNYVDQAVRSLLEGRDPPTTQTEPYGCTVKYENV